MQFDAPVTVQPILAHDQGNITSKYFPNSTWQFFSKYERHKKYQMLQVLIENVSNAILVPAQAKMKWNSQYMNRSRYGNSRPNSYLKLCTDQMKRWFNNELCWITVDDLSFQVVKFHCSQYPPCSALFGNSSSIPSFEFETTYSEWFPPALGIHSGVGKLASFARCWQEMPPYDSPIRTVNWQLLSVHWMKCRHSAYHRQRVIFPNDTFGSPLSLYRRIPWFVDILKREVLQNWLVFSRKNMTALIDWTRKSTIINEALKLLDEVSVGVDFTSEFDGAVAMEKLMEERRTR